MGSLRYCASLPPVESIRDGVLGRRFGRHAFQAAPARRVDAFSDRRDAWRRSPRGEPIMDFGVVGARGATLACDVKRADSGAQRLTSLDCYA
jgi:hypothetical protein